MSNGETLIAEIKKTLGAHQEWLLIHSTGRSFALRAAEIEFEMRGPDILCGFPDERGYQTWRVTDFQTRNEELVLRLARRLPAAVERIRLAPRAASRALSDSVELARLAVANRLAAALRAADPPLRIARVELNRDNGRLAQIVGETRRGAPVAALGDVSESLSPEAVLAAALVWARRLAARRRPIEAVWVLSEGRRAGALQKLHALLRPEWQRRLSLREIVREPGAPPGAALRERPALALDELWRGRPRAAARPVIELAPSAAAAAIVALAPGEIDAVRSARGETLRYRGLAFARVRKVGGRERVWCGTEKTKRPVEDGDWCELVELVETLAAHRRHDAPNRRHAFYEAAPEAWLEAELRRNVRLLDANLMLAPVHQQFRAGREQIDLLALRRDGRLVIVELKAKTDREMALQAADYWRRIERARRSGALAARRIFGDARIADRPAVCYAVAPTLAFHRDFAFLAGCLVPEIELHRFELNENWRERLRIWRRA